MRGWFPSIYFYADIFPPGGVSSFLRARVQLEAIRREPACEFHAKEHAVSVCVCAAIILIEAAATIVAGIDPER